MALYQSDQRSRARAALISCWCQQLLSPNSSKLRRVCVACGTPSISASFVLQHREVHQRMYVQTHRKSSIPTFNLQSRHLPSEIGITYAVGKCRIIEIHFWEHRKSVRTVKVIAGNMSLAIADRIRGCMAVRTARARHRLIFTRPLSSVGLWR